MIRGISFEIPNEYGRFLGQILKPFKVEEYNWWVGGEESYALANGELVVLFPGLIEDMEGETLKDIIENNEYYLIFQDIKAFPLNSKTYEITTYDDFLNSSCVLALLVIDSSYIAVYCKDLELLEGLYNNAKDQGYLNLNYITNENDFRTRLSVW
ncbi:hypothetical protein D3C87_1241660 [compost metagenome]